MKTKLFLCNVLLLRLLQDSPKTEKEAVDIVVTTATEKEKGKQQ